ncbi:MAG: tail fiber domain-containing protein, partial [Verrucomicrobia bacterium]|nr:tail fiber domain-containing protein [Verrucomicrobiota bacterium]
SNPSQPECRGMASDGAGGAAFLRTPRGVTFAGANLAATGSGDSGLALFSFEARAAGFTTDGWVGIGTSLPQAPLHVVGGLHVEGDRASLYANRVEAGYDAHALGDDSLALGKSSLAEGRSSAALGRSAVASGDQSASIGYGTVASGYSATAMGVISVASGNNAVAIGYNNTASGESATALGGGSTASGISAITLGDSAQADGTGAIALGFRAQASHNGSFVWADRTAHSTAASTEANQFTARASGGVRFFSNSNQTTGSRLAPGGNSWSSVSDRAVKENLSPIDPGAILERVAALPITEWNLVSQDPSIRHLGPMAQDFHAAFGLGEDDRHISSSDADGVALAAIQGLHQLLRARDARIAELEARLAALEQTRDQP